MAKSDIKRVAATVMGRAQRGLYAGEHIRFGDTIHESGRRTRRTWKPNVQRVALYSEALDERIPCPVSTAALALVDQAGGLDAYILNQRVPESALAMALKERILGARLAAERRQRGAAPFAPA